MMRDEKERWLKSRGAAGGSLSEFQAHLTKLMETDSEWRDAAAAYKAGRKRLPKPRPIKESDGTTEVHREHATVRDLYSHADFMQKRAKTKAERAAAERMMDAADVARERAGGKLDTPLRNLRDG
jgi:hypothetical protein